MRSSKDVVSGGEMTAELTMLRNGTEAGHTQGVRTPYRGGAGVESERKSATQRARGAEGVHSMSYA
jgi:hypothetical protein